MDDYFRTTNEYLCLTSDAWSNVKGEPVVNYMAISPQKAFLLERVNTGEQSHNAKFIADDIIRVMSPITDKVSERNYLLLGVWCGY
jgi:hypothetical protein